MRDLVILLDDGGVLNDNAARGPQWQRLVGEYFAPRLGGAPAAWAEANRVVIDDLMEAGGWDRLMRAAPNFAAYEADYYSRWLRGMCAEVGVPAPAEAECLAWGIAAEAYIVPRVHSAYPGVVKAIRKLREGGYTLHMASGGGSRLLNMYLEAMGVRDCFGRLYGPDLIETFKTGPAYYARILAELRLRPEQALFVDDNCAPLGWAAQIGARTLLVGQRAEPEGFEQISSLAELPDWLEARGG
jgi:HAD superfamily hydrolase (TIGR01509 family)